MYCSKSFVRFVEDENSRLQRSSSKAYPIGEVKVNSYLPEALTRRTDSHHTNFSGSMESVGLEITNHLSHKRSTITILMLSRQYTAIPLAVTGHHSGLRG